MTERLRTLRIWVAGLFYRLGEALAPMDCYCLGGDCGADCPHECHR